MTMTMPTMSSPLRSSVDHQRVWDLGYELLELSASGPHCDEWRVRHRVTYEVCVWKQLRAEWEHDPAALASLENEAAVGKLIHSPLVLKLIAAHLAERPRYVIWEWFDALPVDQLWREFDPLPIRSALWIARQCAQGLHDLLRGGLLHGNLRPSSVLVQQRTGLVKLTGFGSSRRSPAASPPQGASSDLLQLGLILFRSLAGRLPFAGDSAAEVLRGRDTNVADDLRRARPEITPAIAEVVSDLLSPTGQRRLNHPAELVNRLMELEVDELAASAR